MLNMVDDSSHFNLKEKLMVKIPPSFLQLEEEGNGTFTFRVTQRPFNNMKVVAKINNGKVMYSFHSDDLIFKSDNDFEVKGIEETVSLPLNPEKMKSLLENKGSGVFEELTESFYEWKFLS